MKPPRSLTSVAARSADAIVITDASGRVEWINPAFTRLCGYTLRELKGRKPGPLLQGEDTDPAAARALHDAIHRRRKASVELVNYRKDRSPYAVWIRLGPLKNRAGKLTGFMAIERETTARQIAFRGLEDEIARLYAIICRLTTAQAA